MSMSVQRLKYGPEIIAKRADSQQQLRQACQGFEGIFVAEMLRPMRNTVSGGGILPATTSMGIWQDQFNVALSQTVSKAEALGIAEMLYREIAEATREESGQRANALPKTFPHNHGK